MLHSVELNLSDVKLIIASSDTVPLLLQHKVDAITGVTNAEGSELASEGSPATRSRSRGPRRAELSDLGPRRE